MSFRVEVAGPTRFGVIRDFHDTSALWGLTGQNCKVKTDAAIFDGIIVNPQRPENPVVK